MLKTIVTEVNTNKWADLPVDILKQILKHGHDLKTDLTRLRGVCPSWRSALPLEEHPSFRSHIQVPSLADGIWCDRPLFLLETAFYFFLPLNPCGEASSDSSGWVTRVCQIAPNKWRLLNPLSYDRQYVLTDGYEYVFKDPPIVGEINLLDCRVFMLAKALILVYDLDFDPTTISTKVVGQWDLTSSTRPISAILVLLSEDHVAGHGLRPSRLLLLRPNDALKQENEWVEINEWSQEDNQDYLNKHDIAYSNGIFFVFQVNRDRWRVRTVNPSNKTKLVLNPFASGAIIETLSSVSLVPSKSNGCLLYLVLSPSFGGEECHCFLNENDETSVNESKRKIIKKLGDEILFCSDYVSFSIQSSTPLNNTILQDKNSIAIFYMFSNDLRFNKFIPKGVDGLNLFKYRRYKEMNEKSVLDFDGGKNKVLLLDVMPDKEQDRVYTRLYFPPPAWVKWRVKWRCSSLHNVDINLHDLKHKYFSCDYGSTHVDNEI